MISKQLEVALANLTGFTSGEITQRFQKARDCGLLPRSRGEHAEPLTNQQIAIALLCMVPQPISYAGLRGKALANLMPVGGQDASFHGAETLGDAVIAAIEHPDDVIALKVLDGEFGTNAYGYAELRHTKGVSHYVFNTALPLLKRGAERDFDPRQYFSHDIQREHKVRFQAGAFKIISRKVDEARQHQRLLAAAASKLGRAIAASGN
jgi:hypothetical protein